MAEQHDLFGATWGPPVTPSDTVDLTRVTRALWVGVGGDVTVVFAQGGSPVTLKNCSDGQEVHVQVKRVMDTDTDTDATDIVALY